MGTPASPRDMLWPAIFLLAFSVTVWRMPGLLAAFDMGGGRPEPGAAWPAVIALVMTTIAALAGTATVRPLFGEIAPSNTLDRLSMFLSRPSLLMICAMVCVMVFEVVARYLFRSPTIWANELTVWIAAALFLLGGPYTQQQRSHIAMTILHQRVPRWLRHVFDSLSTLLLLSFAMALIWGGYGEASGKFRNWETLGTIFDPPLPATIKPLVLITVVLTALQAVANLIADWNRDPEYAQVDEAEIEGVRANLGGRDGAAKESLDV